MKKKGNKIVYIYEAIILAYILLYRFIVVNNFISYANYVNICFWLLIGVSLYIIGGFPKDRHYFKKTSIRVVLIVILFYFVISNVLGLFTGFYESTYSHTIVGILHNITPIIIYIVVLELDRYLILRRRTNKIQRYLLGLLFILTNLNITIRDMSSFNSAESIFLTLSLIVFPIISRELLFMYMTNNVSYMPSLIYHVIIDTYTMIIPVLPYLGNYLSSVFLTFLPYTIYIQIKNGIKLKDKYTRFAKKSFIKAISVFLLIIFSILIILVAGIFKYKMVAIASDSMNPVYYRGDAVIYEKVKPFEVLEGEILAFKYDNILVTHRVMKIVEDDKGRRFITKGDNNEIADAYEVRDENVVGVVRYVVKYIAFPTVWFNDYAEEVN